MPDAATEWLGTFGSQGAFIPGLLMPPEIPAVPFTHNGATWIWAQNTTDPRGLLKPGSSGRIASCIYGQSMDLVFTLPGPQRVTFFICDWDTSARQQRIELLKPNGEVEKWVEAKLFNGGAYHGFDVPGSCIFRVRKVAGVNAVINGIFVDPVPVPPDTVSPAMLEMVLGADGRTLTLTATEALNGHDGFSLAAEMPPGPLEFVSVSEDRLVLTYRVTRERPIWHGEVVKLRYTPGDVADDAGNPLVALNGSDVRNDSAVPGPTWETMLTHTVENFGGYRLDHVVLKQTWPEG